jgi:hypothetical protein
MATASATDAPARRRRRPHRLREVDPRRRGLVLAWFSFTGMFLFLRLLTWLIKIDVAGIGNVSAGDVHLHHYLWGILILIGVAFMGLVDRPDRDYRWMGVAFGIGLALIIDEAALLVQLKDVYWESEGIASPAAGVILAGVLGSALALTRSPHVDDREGEGG